MKFMQVYRSSFPSYEGAVVVEDSEASQEKVSGYFEALQAPDGQITIGCFFPGGKWLDAEEDIGNHNLRYYTRDGIWSLQTKGCVRVLSDRCYANHGKGMYEVIISVSSLRAKKETYREKPDYESLRFAVANLVLGQSDSHTPQSLTFDFRNSSLTIKPVEDYLDRVRRLRVVRGVEHTVDIIIRKTEIDSQGFPTRMSLKEAAGLVTDLIPLLRLWSGNKLDWIYGEGCLYTGSPSERLHNFSIIGGYSATALFGWFRPSFPELAALDFPRQVRVLSCQNLRGHIDGFVDACRTSQFRETKGIAAATLLDALAAQYAAAQEKDKIMSGNAFKREVLPALEKAIDDIPLSDDIKCQLRSFVLGGYRTSMRNRVDLLSDELSLCMSDELKSRVIKVRNDLVHKGQFPDYDRGLEDCNLLLWINFAILCRLVGYEGELPPPSTK